MQLPPFQALVDAHAGDLHRFLVAALGADADDCFQDVMITALRGYPTLRDDRNLRGWLFTIAASRIVDVHRGRARRAAPVAEVPDTSTPTDAAPVDDAELWHAVRRLPPMQRAAVLQRYLLDLPFRDIGAALGCSEAAARQNVRAGLARLRLDPTLVEDDA
ncbi:MAG: RNA polymerase sigma factor [Acidimicrobiales bacterium]|nr:RNA polymerase sigma factor [Acidimicrobiales bacterium]